MPCTTLLVGRKASNDGSTMIARNDDSPSGQFHVKKLVKIEADDHPEVYKSVGSHVEVKLPKHSLAFTFMPNVDPKEGLWGAAGINEKNVAMTATETITTNERVLGADPYVELVPKKGREAEIKGGIGEEDLVYLVLPYISSAREGVLRLGSLLEEYGTYEPNGIAFSDEKEIWWLETIGGHHYIAARVQDEEVVLMPNQFGLDRFDFEDELGEGKNYLCSKDLKEFVENNSLALDQDDKFNPRLAFGSHSDSDHVYNTPRAWYMLKCLTPVAMRENVKGYTPESDDLPWSVVPEHKLTVEDVKYILSAHYQGTVYDPYSKYGPKDYKGAYRPIGVNRTSFLALLQIRPIKNGLSKAIEWFTFGSNVFNEFVPFFTQGDKVPSYYGKTTLNVDSNNFYWANRLIGALADSHYQTNAIEIERYQNALAAKAMEFVHQADKLTSKENLEKLNQKIADEAKTLTDKCLAKVLYAASMGMKNAYSRSDN